MNNEPFVIERTFNAPVNKVWQAITDSEKMKQWYFDLPGFKPEVGYEFSFKGGHEDGIQYNHLCRVLEVVPGQKLKHSWDYEGYEGHSFVTWELFEEGEKTRVKLTHEGLETFPVSNPDLAKSNFVAGWTDIVGNNLKEFVENGYVNKEAVIAAPAAKVWEVLTDNNLVRQWASAFGEGVYAESDWQKGSEVLWKDADGNIGVRGVVMANVPSKTLRVQFYDEVDITPETQLGDYMESFSLVENNGSTTLVVSNGPFALSYVKMFNPMWDKALDTIKDMAIK